MKFELYNYQIRILFNIYKSIWYENTYFMSVIEDTYEHPIVKDIIDLGPKVVPLIIEEIGVRPYHWFGILVQLTGENPGDGIEDIDELVEAWKNWFVENKKEGLK